MEIFLLIVLLALVIWIINVNLSQKQSIDILKKELSYIKTILLQQHKRDEASKQTSTTPEPQKHQVTAEPIISVVPPKPKPEVVIAEPKPLIIKSEDILPKAQKIEPKPIPNKVKIDIEKFIGENLINKIGILILVLGMGYFVKYAIDQQWIGVYGRALIGILTGGLLIGIAHRMRSQYQTFSSVLVGGGFAVLYLTIAISFHQYQIFSQPVAFALLVLITAFSVILTLAYDRKELAIFSQIGGYLSPFMVATGDGNYIVLFSYLLILNGGLISLAYFKRWNILNLLSFIFTVLIFSGWLTSIFLQNHPMPYVGAFIYAFLFYLVFFLVNMLNAIREHKPLTGPEIGLILADNLFFFLSGMTILYGLHDGMFKGLFTVLLALYNFGWLIFLFKKNQADKNLIFLLVGLVLSLISMAIPIQLNGHSITLFWTAEFVILLWLSRKTGIALLKIGHIIIMLLIVISQLMDWNLAYNSIMVNYHMRVVFNQAFITGICVLAGLIFAHYYIRKDVDTFISKPLILTAHYKIVLTFLIIFLSYFVCILELIHQMNWYYTIDEFRQIVYGLFNFSFLLIWLIIFKKTNQFNMMKVTYGLSCMLLLIYFIFYNPANIVVRDSYLLNHRVTVLNFLFHYLTLIPIGLLITMFLKNREILTKSIFSRIFLWFAIFSIVYILSSELDTTIVFTKWKTITDFDHLLTISHRVGYPILWAAIALILILHGINKRNKDYRIISLSIISLIVLKLFAYDVWSMNEGGRVASFIFLGVIMLVISFLYQKLKRLFVDDSNNQSIT